MTPLRGPMPGDPTVGGAAKRRHLLESIPKHSVGAEVGVWRGEFAAVALEVVKPAQLHLIDPWQFRADPQYRRAMYGGLIARSQADMDDVYRSVLDRFDPEIAAGVIHVHRARSDEAADRFSDGSLDWVYVDGDHYYEAVFDDLTKYWPKVRPGGSLYGDDYPIVTAWWGDGVKRAVDEFALRRDAAVTLRRDQWEIPKPSP